MKTDRFVEGIKNYKEGTDVITGTKYLLANTITLPKKSALILELK
ncbi:MAG: cyclomaltodextrinase C-terminal domain-containing protein [Bacteroidota bacterium]|nr:cyclomaltodextrinase C-terminal domain-containing protein [Bacteroidota bacterium]